MAIVWACALSVDEYVAAGQAVAVLRPECPACAAAMTFWSGYERSIRHSGLFLKPWIRRVRCRRCGATHALVPSFCLAFAAVRSRAGPALPSLWGFVTLVTGGGLLATNTNSLSIVLGRRRFIVPVPGSDDVPRMRRGRAARLVPRYRLAPSTASRPAIKETVGIDMALS